MKPEMGLLFAALAVAACNPPPKETAQPLKAVAVNACVDSSEYPDGADCTCYDIFGKPATGCIKMPIGCPDTQEPTPTVLSNPTLVAYTSTMPLVADYSTCTNPDGGTCTSGPAFDASSVHYVAEFVDANHVNVYAVPNGASWVRSPTGKDVFPLLPTNDTFANSGRQITFAGQTYSLNDQNDCRMSADGCKRCTTC